MEQLLDGLYIKLKNQDIIDEIDNIYRFIDICWFIYIKSIHDFFICYFLVSYLLIASFYMYIVLKNACFFSG